MSYWFELRLHLVTQSINMRTIDYQQIISIDDQNSWTFKISLDSSGIQPLNTPSKMEIPLKVY